MSDDLRARFEEWAAPGHAKREGRVRKYRAIIVPCRAHAELAYRAGQRAAEAALPGEYR